MRLEVVERLGKKAQLIAKFQALGLGLQPKCTHTLRTQPRALVHPVKIRQCEKRRLQGCTHEVNLGELLPQTLEMRGLFSGVRHPDARPTKHSPTGHGKTGVSKSQNEQLLMSECEHGVSLTSTSSLTIPPGTAAW